MIHDLEIWQYFTKRAMLKFDNILPNVLTFILDIPVDNVIWYAMNAKQYFGYSIFDRFIVILVPVGNCNHTANVLSNDCLGAVRMALTNL